MTFKEFTLRAMAVGGGLVTFVVALVLMDILGDIFTAWAHAKSYEHAWLASAVNWELVPGWRLVGPVVLFAYPACCGLTTAAVFWQGWPATWGRFAIYLLLMLLITPMSWINYAMSDQWLNLWVQAAFNLLMAVFFLAVVYALRAVKSQAHDVKAVQSVAILTLTSFGVWLPVFYTSVFLASAANLLSHDQVAKIPTNAPLIFAGGAGAASTFLAQLEKLRRPTNLPGSRRRGRIASTVRADGHAP